MFLNLCYTYSPIKLKESILNIHTVTFSGASNGTSITKMCDLYETHPYIEWGIQTPHFGGGLFPDAGWVKELTSTDLPLSAHMCSVKELLENSNPVEVLSIEGWDSFQRVQINTHGHPHHTQHTTLELFKSDLFSDKEIIFQLDDVPMNTYTFGLANSLGVNVSGLFDTSHGSGTSPNVWPKANQVLLGGKFGYSGGLGPDNMRTVLPQIAVAAGDADIWIDMEGKIRNYGTLDFDKIQRVLDEVENSGYLKQ